MDILCEMNLIGSLYIQNASVAMTPLLSSLGHTNLISCFTDPLVQ